MAYKDVLSKIIKNSKLPLRDISARCKDFGVEVSSSYISQLQTGKLPPATEEVNVALGNVCGVEPAELVIEAYLEKAPEIVRDYILLSMKLNDQMLDLMANKAEIGFTAKEIEEVNFISKLDYFITYFDTLKKRMHEKSDIDIYKIVRNKYTGKFRLESRVFMEDDSMEPLIPKNSPIEYDKNSNEWFKEKKVFNDNDIIVFYYKNSEDKKMYIRRYYKNENTIILLAENKKYTPIYVTEEDISIFGKVTGYKVNI